MADRYQKRFRVITRSEDGMAKLCLHGRSTRYSDFSDNAKPVGRGETPMSWDWHSPGTPLTFAEATRIARKLNKKPSDWRTKCYVKAMPIIKRKPANKHLWS